MIVLQVLIAAVIAAAVFWTLGFRLLQRVRANFIHQDSSLSTGKPSRIPGDSPPKNLVGAFDAPSYNGRERFARYGDIYYVWSGLRPILILANPRATEDFYANKQHEHGRDFSYLGSLFQGLMEHSLGYSRGHRWTRLRKIFHSSFTMKCVGNDVDRLSTVARQWVNSIVPLQHQKQSIDVDIWASRIGRLPLRMLSSIVFGELTDAEWSEMESLFTLHELIMSRMMSPWTRLPFYHHLPTKSNSLLHEFNRRWLAFNNAQAAKHLGNRFLSLDQIYAAGGAASDDSCVFVRTLPFLRADGLNVLELVHTMYELVMFNVDISGASLAWFLVSVAQYPHVQQRLREELQRQSVVLDGDSEEGEALAVEKKAESDVEGGTDGSGSDSGAAGAGAPAGAGARPEANTQLGIPLRRRSAGATTTTTTTTTTISTISSTTSTTSCDARLVADSTSDSEAYDLRHSSDSAPPSSSTPIISPNTREEWTATRLWRAAKRPGSYLDWVQQESARLHPGLVLSFPEVTHQPTVIDGYAVPAGVQVCVDASALNRHPDHWAHADSFDPLRFDSTTYNHKQRFAFHRFGIGSRHCLGKDYASTFMKFVMLLLLSEYRLSIAESDDSASSSLPHALDSIPMLNSAAIKARIRLTPL